MRREGRAPLPSSVNAPNCSYMHTVTSVTQGRLKRVRWLRAWRAPISLTEGSIASQAIKVLPEFTAFWSRPWTTETLSNCMYATALTEGTLRI